MKKFVSRIVLIIMVSLPLITLAQKSPIDKLFEKYAGHDCFTTVNISSEMFGLFANFENNADDQDFEDFQKMIKQLEGLKILSFTPGIDCSSIDFYKEVLQVYPMEEYTELMVVQEKGEEVRFYVKKNNGGISELLMIAKETDEIVVLSLAGMLDMSYISKLSKSMNIHGLDKLEKIEEEERED